MHPMRYLILTAMMAAGTVTVGWWAIPVVAALWCVLTRNARQHHAAVALSAALSWGVLLGVMAIRGPIDRVAEVLGGIIPVGAIGIFAVTLLFPALLAGAASMVTAALAGAGQSS
jgi:hypothetical protein